MDGMTINPAVRRQYQTYPYPQRDPEAERERLRTTILGQLSVANHLLWTGARPFGADFRVLDAGCGTGDAAIFMAEQLRGTGAQAVALDFSEPSLEIARRRAEVRDLDNLTFVHSPIEDLPGLDLAPFDYIVSSGVLMVLTSPLAGLQALRAVLKPDGGMGIMLYGAYGRTAIYQLQALFRYLAPPDWPVARRMQVVRTVLPRLHAGHWATFSHDLWKNELQTGGDAGLYDLLLHEQDRAFTVTEIYDLLADAKMQLRRWQPAQIYDLSLYLPNMDLSPLSSPEQEAAAELLFGRLATHHFLAVRDDYTVPQAPAARDGRAVPYWLLHESPEFLERALAKGKVDVQTGIVTKTYRIDECAGALLRHIDGAASLEAVITAGAETCRRSTGEIWDAWSELYPQLSAGDVVGLRPAA